MNIIRVLIICIFTTTLISCKNDTTDLDRFFAAAKLVPPKQIEALPIINPPEIFVYEASESRDPFSNDLIQLHDEQAGNDAPRVTNGEGPDLNRRKEILENYPLDSLFMVGTYLQEDSYWGLIEDPEGVVYRVSINEYMGLNYGKIIAINEDQIDVSEWISDGLDGWIKREASIALREQQ